MGNKGQETKDRLMDIAERSILNKGFSATSIDELISEAGITKSGFFYHFENKNALAYAIMQRNRNNDELLFRGFFERATELTDDPLQQMLIFIKLLAEMMAELKEVHPGCLVASFTYETHEINQEVRGITADIIKDWRNMFEEQFEKINQQYDIAIESNSTDLADMLSTILEGGIIVSRAVNDPQILPKQLLEYRKYIQLLYSK